MKVLAIYYSQSGQLGDIISNFVSPIENADIDVVRIRPRKDFPFPWNNQNFYNEMPDCVLEIPQELETIHFKHQKYDLIIFGYQPWFLSPSIPAISLLKNDAFKSLLLDTPVITVIGARNMWLNAQESVKKCIHDAGGRLIGNVPLIDKTPNLISALTIVHWMKTGKKTRMFGFFPLPGISDADIKGVSRFGTILNDKIRSNQLALFQDSVLNTGEININSNILFIEKRAKRLFILWANLINKKVQNNGNKTFWTQFFRYYLLVALFVVSPILLTVYNLLIKPFSRATLKKEKAYFYHTELRKK
jgi:hypothetical protein